MAGKDEIFGCLFLDSAIEKQLSVLPLRNIVTMTTTKNTHYLEHGLSSSKGSEPGVVVSTIQLLLQTGGAPRDAMSRSSHEDARLRDLPRLSHQSMMPWPWWPSGLAETSCQVNHPQYAACKS